jgi:hypothetical protein
MLRVGLLLFALLPTAGASAQPATRVTFAEAPAPQSGITWTHDNAASPLKHFPETVGAGGAFFDYNNDGWMDVYLVNSGAADFFTPKKPLRNALYRNNGDGTFTDVTLKAGVAGGQFGMGVAAADYNGDSWTDIYVTNYGRNLLYRNNGDGTFTEVAEKAGLDLQGWTTSAVWFDFDNDARLDLFVSSYVHYDPQENHSCGDAKAQLQQYCAPWVFRPTTSFLFHNNGDGTFSDVSKTSGIAETPGKAFGAVATDVNNDGLLDLFVANDMVANFLFINRGGGKFEETGLLAGVAYNDLGNARSGMGVDAADVDGDGWQDLFVANIDSEMFSLYRNLKGVEFADHSEEIRQATRLLSGWGLRFFDYDNDGDPDLILANGHPNDYIERYKPSVTYKEPLMLFENIGGKFADVSAQSGGVFAKQFPARGLATGDYDNDGDLDVLVANNGAAPLLLNNNGGSHHKLGHWVGLHLVATKSNPAAVGALISWTAGGVRHSRLKTAGGSYLASHDPREILGIGPSDKIDSLEIKWPSGQVDKLTNVAAGRYLKLVEGKGIIETTGKSKMKQ